MRYKKIRIFLVNQHEEEEKWLNEMSAKGLAMVSIVGGIFYEFKQCEPGEYIYRLELLEHHVLAAESINYIQFVEDTGAEMMGSWIRWVYFRKKAKDGKFDLFSDLDSRMKHFVRIRNLIMPLLFLELSLAGINLYNYLIMKYRDELAMSLNRTNLFFSILFWSISIFLLLLLISLQKKVMSLKKEKRIRE